MLSTLAAPSDTESVLATLKQGARWDGAGVEFRLRSRNAERVELCLFEDAAGRGERRHAMARHGDLWRLRLDGLGPGALYGYRVHGPYAPQHGLFFNPSKLLIDPYALAVTGEPEPDPSLFGFTLGQEPRHSFDSRDSAPHMPKCVVVDPNFDWQGVEKPRTPWPDTVVYETHVRGATRLHPEIDESLRGTYLGLIQEPMLRHLKTLGITAVELMPVFQSAPEAHLLFQGRSNYWGYSPVSFFAPRAHYAVSTTGNQAAEFKTMVRELHRAGIEVILDVVFNHTAEGGAQGPTYGFKGIDCPSYYLSHPHLPGRGFDYTGCGNTLDLDRELTFDLVVDSLRYWVHDMQVDGFRFDLGPVVGRHRGEFRADAPLFRHLAEDPTLAHVKWIAEPWDLGPYGYRLGQFPPPWREWNDRYRDTVRRFWSGRADGGVTAELSRRLDGSPDLLPSTDGKAGDGPRSLNYVISHDGFTLNDWVSYEHKRNEANGEQNRDGTDNNLSCAWGPEGPTDDAEVLSLRRRARLNVLATLLFSRGVPMLAHGDELGSTRHGNNNPYCQDNEIAWTDWSAVDRELCAQVAGLLVLRRRFPQLRESRRDASADRTEGEILGGTSLIRTLPGSKEQPGRLLLVLNGGGETLPVSLPAPARWTSLFDSAARDPFEARVLDRQENRPPFSLLLALDSHSGA